MFYLMIRWAILALAIGLTTWLLPGFQINGGFPALFLVAAVLGLINAFIRPIITFLTCPLIMVTLGLFTLVINAAMLSLTVWLLPSAISSSGFWTTFFASLIISIISALLGIFVHDEKRR